MSEQGDADYSRGLAALRALLSTDGSDWDEAGDAFFAILEMCVEPESVPREQVEAVGRIVRVPPL